MFNLFVMLMLSYSLRHITFNKLTLCLLKSNMHLVKCVQVWLTVNVCQPFTGIQHVRPTFLCGYNGLVDQNNNLLFLLGSTISGNSNYVVVESTNLFVSCLLLFD